MSTAELLQGTDEKTDQFYGPPQSPPEFVEQTEAENTKKEVGTVRKSVEQLFDPEHSAEFPQGDRIVQFKLRTLRNSGRGNKLLYSNLNFMSALTDESSIQSATLTERGKQMQRIEMFIGQIVPENQYSLRTVREAIGFEPLTKASDATIEGKALLHDLRVLIEDLSDACNIEVDGTALTVEGVSERYNVSTKTVDRWRDRGLVSRRLLFGKKKRVGFLLSSVERFVAKNAEEVRHTSNFSQLTSEERNNIISRAKELARTGGGLSEISRQIAEEKGRSPETIRYTIRNHDEANTDEAVFPGYSTRLTDEQKETIYNALKSGTSALALSRQYNRTQSSIRRIANEARAQKLLSEPIEFMDSPEFTEPNAENIIMGPPPVTKKKRMTKAPPGLPPYLTSLYDTPLLTREDEQYYFRKMNYLKYKANSLREGVQHTYPKSGDLNAIEQLLDKSLEIKNFLIRSNLRLVVSVAKRYIEPNTNLFELVSDGNMSLMRAIEKFQYTKGNRLSTYATWAIMKNFARSVPKEREHKKRFQNSDPTVETGVISGMEDHRTNGSLLKLQNASQREKIKELLTRINERDAEIIRLRFGLTPGTKPQTLQKVGEHFGVTKERIRQLEARAFKKLQKIAQDMKLDIPGIEPEYPPAVQKYKELGVALEQETALSCKPDARSVMHKLHQGHPFNDEDQNWLAKHPLDGSIHMIDGTNCPDRHTTEQISILFGSLYPRYGTPRLVQKSVDRYSARLQPKPTQESTAEHESGTSPAPLSSLDELAV